MNASPAPLPGRSSACSCWSRLAAAWTLPPSSRTRPSDWTPTGSWPASVGGRHPREHRCMQVRWPVSCGGCVPDAPLSDPLPLPPPQLAAGLSNVAVGIIGTPFLGSYIFSQSIFTGRAGVHSRLNGAGGEWEGWIGGKGPQSASLHKLPAVLGALATQCSLTASV